METDVSGEFLNLRTRKGITTLQTARVEWWLQITSCHTLVSDCPLEIRLKPSDQFSVLHHKHNTDVRRHYGISDVRHDYTYTFHTKYVSQSSRPVRQTSQLQRQGSEKQSNSLFMTGHPSECLSEGLHGLSSSDYFSVTQYLPRLLNVCVCMCVFIEDWGM